MENYNHLEDPINDNPLNNRSNSVKTDFYSYDLDMYN